MLYFGVAPNPFDHLSAPRLRGDRRLKQKFRPEIGYLARSDMNLSDQLNAIRQYYTNLSPEELHDARERSLKYDNQPVADVLGELLQERLTNDDSVPLSWIHANANQSVKEATTQVPLKLESKKEERAKEIARVERETDGGRYLPRPKDPDYPKTPCSPTCEPRLDPWQSRPRGACPDCDPYRRIKAPSCTGACRQ
jgi:hypothetical protein